MTSGIVQATLAIFFFTLLRPGITGGRYEMPFGCAGMTMSDQTRQGAVNLINGIRSRLALGEFQAQNFLPSASNMNKLKWDCILEEMAQMTVLNCPEDQPPPPEGNARNYIVYDPGTSPFILSNPIESSVLKWAEITNMAWPTNNKFDGNPALHDFSNMIRRAATDVGCASAVCGNRAAAACFFSLPDVTFGTTVYNAGNPCQKDEDCTRFMPAFCEIGLCVRGTKAPTVEPPPDPTTPSPPVTRGISANCPSTAFSSDYRETALGIHNNFRSLVARGLARNGEYANENAPPSSRMNLLEYDCNAEQYALNHVRSCDRQMLPASSRPGLQENIHILQSTATDVLGAIQNALMTWNNELAGNGIPSNMILTPQVLQRRQKSVAKVTKVIWGANKYVGCATQMCNGFYFTSCMYREPVNVVGQSIYTIGAVCGACPAGPANCNGNIGLCSW